MPGFIDYGLGGVAYDLDPTAPTTPRTPPSEVGPGAWIAQPQGTTRRYRAALFDPTTGLPVPAGFFEPSATPSAIVWEGGPGPVLATPATAWDTTDHIAIVLTIAAADLVALELQPYPIRLLVDDAGFDPVDVWDGLLEVTAAPATAGPVPTYGTYLDLVEHCGDRLAQFLTPDQRAGFLVERGKARTWLDGIILAHYRPKYTSYYGVGMAYTYGTGSLFPLGIGSLGYPVAQQGPDPTLLAALVADGLNVTPRVTEAVSCYAGALVLGRQTAKEWQAAGLALRLRAEAIAGSLIAQVSTTGDDQANLLVNLSVFDGRDI